MDFKELLRIQRLAKDFGESNVLDELRRVEHRRGRCVTEAEVLARRQERCATALRIAADRGCSRESAVEVICEETELDPYAADRLILDATERGEFALVGGRLVAVFTVGASAIGAAVIRSAPSIPRHRTTSRGYIEERRRLLGQGPAGMEAIRDLGSRVRYGTRSI